MAEDSCTPCTGLIESQDRLQQRDEEEQEQLTLAHSRTYVLARRLFQVSDTRVLCACTKVNAFLSYTWQHWDSNLLGICYWFALSEGMADTDAMVVAESQQFLNSIPKISLWAFWFSEEFPCFSARTGEAGRQPPAALPWGSCRMTLRGGWVEKVVAVRVSGVYLLFWIKVDFLFSPISIKKGKTNKHLLLLLEKGRSCTSGLRPWKGPGRRQLQIPIMTVLKVSLLAPVKVRKKKEGKFHF